MQMLGVAQPSMVTIERPRHCPASRMQEFTALPSSRTVQRAFGLKAVLLGAGHAELAPQHVQQRPMRLDLS